MSAAPTIADESQTTEADFARHLMDQGHSYDFYQAISLLSRLQASDASKPDSEEALRFVTSPSLSFPASAIQRIDLPNGAEAPTVTVNFMGLTGPSGVLPRHYTEKVMEVERDGGGKSRSTIRAWFDMFTSRFVWSMYRAWRKMRIDRSLPEQNGPRPAEGAFAQGLFSLIGFGQRSLRERLHVGADLPTDADHPLAVDDRIRDWALLRHTSVLARRRRSASQIARVLSDYFQLPVHVEQFQGQWLELDTESQTRLGDPAACSQLGMNAIVGRRVWDLESKLRLRVGPLNAEQFDSLLPCTSPTTHRRRFFMLCQLARLLIGPEFDIDVQLVLDRQAVPALKLQSPGSTDHYKLGWNTWLAPQNLSHDADDAVFSSIESTVIGEPTSHQHVA